MFNLVPDNAGMPKMAEIYDSRLGITRQAKTLTEAVDAANAAARNYEGDVSIGIFSENGFEGWVANGVLEPVED